MKKILSSKKRVMRQILPLQAYGSQKRPISSAKDHGKEKMGCAGDVSSETTGPLLDDESNLFLYADTKRVE